MREGDGKERGKGIGRRGREGRQIPPNLGCLDKTMPVSNIQITFIHSFEGQKLFGF